MSEPEWRRLNRANWDERVDVHLGPGGYDLTELRRGAGRLTAVEEALLPPLAGRRVLHLQCHIGSDTLVFAQRGAEVVGLDFSPRAVAAATALAGELGLGEQARFVEADLYDAPQAIGGQFDLVFVNWGAICWLPDIDGWARVVAGFVRPGGMLVMAEGHPAALVMDSGKPTPEGLPGYDAPYFLDGPLLCDEERDYSDPDARLQNRSTQQFFHPLGDVVSALIRHGLTLEVLREHREAAWKMFDCLVPGSDGMWRWPDRAWLPLAYTLAARRSVTNR